MNVIYKKWKDGEGLEEIQAQIYTEASGIVARGWQIRERNNQRGPDFTRYALTDDGKPLAYVTSFTNPNEKEALIGYPWKMPDCPTEVQEKIFNEQLEYLETLEDIDAIMTAVVLDSKISEKQVEWFESRGFTREDSIYRYSSSVGVEEASSMNVEGKAVDLDSRTTSTDDIEQLVELFLVDENLRGAFANKDGFRQYLEERVFKDHAPLVLLDGEQFVAATAPLRFKPDGDIIRGDEERIIMRFQAIRLGYSYAWHKMFVEFAKYCKDLGWTDLSIQTDFGFTSSDPQPSGIAKMIPELHEFEIRYYKR